LEKTFTELAARYSMVGSKT